MAKKKIGGHQASNRKKKKKARSWWWFVLIFGMTWFLTGFPMSFLRPEWMEVRATATTAPYGFQASSWRQDLELEVTSSITTWGRGFGIHESTLRGAFRAASLERNLETGKPEVGTGNRVDAFSILAITSKESSLGGDTVNPEQPNPTGYCRAWSELMRHKLLNGPGEIWALRKIVRPLGYSEWRVYGSCGAGCIGWTQALPRNWWRLMGPGFNPWSREDAAEFTARYLTVHGYFTHGRRYAVHAYNPNAADSIYTLPVVYLAEKLEQSFSRAGLTMPKVRLAEELELEPETRPALETTEIRLSQWPVQARRSGVPFGEPTIFQPQGHTGVDFGVPVGTPIKAVGPGIVVWADWWPEGQTAAQRLYWKMSRKGHGNTVWLLHGFTAEGEPVYSVYAHLSEFRVEMGDRVQTGTIVGLSGNTGASSGPHLHFAVRVGGGWRRDGTDDQGRKWQDGRWVNPDEWVSKDAPSFFTEIPTYRGEAGEPIPPGQEVLLTLKETPALRMALWVGELLDIVRTGRELSGFIEKIPKIGRLVELLQKAEEPLDRLHALLSVWSIAGQPRELGLDPLLNWRILGKVK